MHVLLLVNGYVTPHDAAYGDKFRVLAQTMRAAGFKIGVVGCNQKFGDRLEQPLLGQTWLVQRDDDDVPVFYDYAWRLVPRVPGVSKADDVRIRVAIAARALETYSAQYGQPDVIHAHGAKWAGVVAAFLKAQFGLPYVLTEHTSMFARNLVHDWQRPLLEDAFRQADARTVVSEPFGRILENSLGDTVRPWHVVPNLVDEAFLNVKGIVNRSAEGDFRFFNAGRMAQVKGHADLIEAFAKAFGKDPEVTLRIAGDGELRAELQSLAERRGVSNRVTFLGQISRQHIVGEMHQCDAYVTSSHFETFAIPLVEATACGKPVVATACGGPESIVNRTNGILVKTGSVDMLSEAMQKLRRGIARYDAIAIRTQCLESFSPEVVAARYGNLLNHAVDSGAT